MIDHYDHGVQDSPALALLLRESNDDGSDPKFADPFP